MVCMLSFDAMQGVQLRGMQASAALTAVRMWRVQLVYMDTRRPC